MTRECTTNLCDKVCHKTSTIDIEKCQIVARFKATHRESNMPVPRKLECCNCWVKL